MRPGRGTNPWPAYDKNKATDKKTDESDRTNESNDNPIEDNGTEDSNVIPLDEGDRCV